MAKAAWLTTSPNSGNGNGAISNSASKHTGRVARVTNVTVTGVGVSVPATYKVTQKATPEFVSFTNGSEMSAQKAGGVVTIEGKSNSQALTYSFVGDAFGVELPLTYTANGASTNNGEDILGDPGATAEYDSSIELTLPANDTVSERTLVLKVESKGGKSAQISIVQSAGDAYIQVTPNEITLEADGSAVSVNVKANTQWTVE